MRVLQKFEFNLIKRYFSDTKYLLYAYILIHIHIQEGREREKCKEIYTCFAGYFFVKLMQISVLWEEGHSIEKKIHP